LDDGMSAIVVEGLRVAYGGVEAVRGVDLTVEPGEVLALLGPNGAGKTSTVEVMEGYRSRSAGRVEVLGHDPAVDLPRQRIGVVLQESSSDPYLTVAEVVRKFGGYYPRPRPVEEVLGLVGLTDKAGARVRTLSGGQQRRLDVGLGIVGSPELIFLDEPTTGFDPSARRGAWELIRQLTGDGTTVLLTTHYMDEAQALADRVVVLVGGVVVAEGSPTSLGGRDTQAVVIRFGAAHTPPFGERVDGLWEVRTEDEVSVLHRLTTWSLDTGTPLTGLTVGRPSLEDIYLELTS
jgi:ABC-2 type transport system ATP-binding protein